jgi:hypothetical protein
MSDGSQMYPPPGAPPPDQGTSWTPAPHVPPGSPVPHAPPGPPVPQPTSWAPYPTSGPGPRAGLALGAAHRPGAFPLRPLRLGDMYDGAFRIIRFNPKATVGAAVLVTAVAMLLPVLVTAGLTASSGFVIDESGELSTDAGVLEGIGLLSSLGLAYVGSFIGITLVTGMVVHVARAAAVGQRLDLGHAWAATRGKRWRLIGLAVLTTASYLALIAVYVLLWIVLVAAGASALPLVLWGLVTVPAFIALCVWLWIRVFYLAVPTLMLEPVGVYGAIGRGWRLTGRQFWRTFGIALLTAIIGGIGGSLLSTPFSFVGNIASFAFAEYGFLILVVSQAVAMVVQNAFTAPFMASVTSLQYLDQRIRKEALDVELLREAGIVGA